MIILRVLNARTILPAESPPTTTIRIVTVDAVSPDDESRGR